MYNEGKHKPAVQDKVISTFDMDEALFNMHIRIRHPEFTGEEPTLLAHSESHCLIPRVLNHFHETESGLDAGAVRCRGKS